MVISSECRGPNIVMNISLDDESIGTGCMNIKAMETAMTLTNGPHSRGSC
jgi:hypothetical protein